MLQFAAISLHFVNNFISFANLFPPPVPSFIFFPFFTLLQLFIPHLLLSPLYLLLRLFLGYTACCRRFSQTGLWIGT